MKQQLLFRRLPQLPLKTFFLAFGLCMISTLSVSAQKKFFEIHDNIYNNSLMGGDNADGKIYHYSAKGRRNAQWKFEKNSDGSNYYFITDRKHQDQLGAGNNNNNGVWHYSAFGTEDYKQWSLIDVDGRGVLFYIKNRKYNKFLVANNPWNGGISSLQDTSSAALVKRAIWRLIDLGSLGEDPLGSDIPKDVNGKEVNPSTPLYFTTNNNSGITIYGLPKTLCGEDLGKQIIQGNPGSPPNNLDFMNSIPVSQYGAMDQNRESGEDYLISIYVNSQNRIDHPGNFVELIDPTYNDWPGEKSGDDKDTLTLTKVVGNTDSHIGVIPIFYGQYRLNTVSKEHQLPFGTASLLCRFFIQELNTSNGLILNNNRIQIPCQATGIVKDQVDSIGTTVEPQIPYLVLHDPPGDGSYSSFLENKTICRQFEDTYTIDESNNIHGAVKIGTAGSIGFIATVDYEFSITLSGGSTNGSLSTTTVGQQNCVNTSTTFSTSQMDPIGSEGGDIFIGYGTDLAYGKYAVVEFDSANCKSNVVERLIYRPTGIPRRFTYTEAGIRDEIESLKNIMEDSTSNDFRSRRNADNQIKVWDQVLALNEQNKANASEIIDQVSFQAGSDDRTETSVTVMNTESIVVEHWIEKKAGMETVLEIGGSGGSFGYEYSTQKRYGQTSSGSEEVTKMVSYDFIDGDTGDKFNVDVYRDPMFGTPVFRLLNSSKTSCPYEGGYQRDQPRFKFADQDENEISLVDLPVGQPVQIPVKLYNDSNEPRAYVVQLTGGSTGTDDVKMGAKSITGGDFYQTLTIPANGFLTEVLSVTNQSMNCYYDLIITMYPVCDPALTSDIKVSVCFGTTAVLEQSPVTLLSVFPNPTSGELIADFTMEESADVRFELYDMVGNRSVLASEENFAAGPQRKEMNVAQLPSGIYELAIKTNKSVISRKVIVQH